MHISQIFAIKCWPLLQKGFEIKLTKVEVIIFIQVEIADQKQEGMVAAPTPQPH